MLCLMCKNTLLIGWVLSAWESHWKTKVFTTAWVIPKGWPWRKFGWKCTWGYLQQTSGTIFNTNNSNNLTTSREKASSYQIIVLIKVNFQKVLFVWRVKRKVIFVFVTEENFFSVNYNVHYNTFLFNYL